MMKFPPLAIREQIQKEMKTQKIYGNGSNTLNWSISKENEDKYALISYATYKKKSKI